MCRAIIEGGRRCPCSSPARRSAYRRALRAAKAAAGATEPARENLAPPAPTEVIDPGTIAELAVHASELYRSGTEVEPFTLSPDGIYAREREQAVTALGAQVAQRAEFHAGITSEQAEAEWQVRHDLAEKRYDEAKATLEVHLKALEEASDTLATARIAVRESTIETNAAAKAESDRAFNEHERVRLHYARVEEELGVDALRVELRDVIQGTDRVSIQHLQRLSNGYRQALAEVREVGGTVNFHDRSAKKAVPLFSSAAQVFPTDWIAASNARPAPIAKVTTSRAHYVDLKVANVKKRIAVVASQSYPEGVDPREGLSGYGAVLADYAVAEDQGAAAPGSVLWTKTHYEVPSWSTKTRNGVPVGHGWKEVAYTDSNGFEQTTWRRVQTRLKTVSTEFAPEITTSTRHSPVGEDGYKTAVHELSHRFEASVPMIGQMEADFLERRTTHDGKRDPLRRYGMARGEYVRPDDFVNEYMGKDYKSAVYHEVLSTGTEGLFGGGFGGLAGIGQYKRDDDMRHFVLGVLSTARN